MTLEASQGVKALLDFDIPSDKKEILQHFYFDEFVVANKASMIQAESINEMCTITKANFMKNPNFLLRRTPDEFLYFLASVDKTSLGFIFLFQFGWMNGMVNMSNANDIAEGWGK